MPRVNDPMMQRRMQMQEQPTSPYLIHRRAQQMGVPVGPMGGPNTSTASTQLGPGNNPVRPTQNRPPRVGASPTVNVHQQQQGPHQGGSWQNPAAVRNRETAQANGNYYQEGTAYNSRMRAPVQADADPLGEVMPTSRPQPSAPNLTAGGAGPVNWAATQAAAAAREQSHQEGGAGGGGGNGGSPGTAVARNALQQATNVTGPDGQPLQQDENGNYKPGNANYANARGYDETTTDFLTNGLPPGWYVDNQGYIRSPGPEAGGYGDSKTYHGIANNPADYSPGLRGHYSAYQNKKAAEQPQRNPYDFEIREPPKRDPQALAQMDAATRQRYAQEQGRLVQAALQGGARAGVDPEAQLGQLGDVTSQIAIASAQQRTQQQFEWEMQNHKDDMAWWEAEYQRMMQLAQNLAGTQEGELAYQRMLEIQYRQAESANRLSELEYKRSQSIGWKDVLGAGLGVGSNAAPAIIAAATNGFTGNQGAMTSPGAQVSAKFGSGQQTSVGDTQWIIDQARRRGRVA